METHRANYLGPQYDGIPLKIDPKDPHLMRDRLKVFTKKSKQPSSSLLGQLNQLTADQFPNDPMIEARMKSYELAFRMQTAVPDIVDFSQESQRNAGRVWHW